LTTSHVDTQNCFKDRFPSVFGIHNGRLLEGSQ